VKMVGERAESICQAQLRSQSQICIRCGATARPKRFNRFSRPKFLGKGSESEPKILRDGVTKLNQIFERHRTVIDYYFIFQTSCFLAKLDYPKVQIGIYDFKLFDPV